jgi:type I site-specific restriction endonuclease
MSNTESQMSKCFLVNSYVQNYMSAYRVSEQQTPYSLNDPQLRRAGWNIVDHTQVGTEIPIVANSEEPRHPERTLSERSESKGESKDEQSRTITDYCLYRTNGEVLAVVEAKRTSRDPRVGKQQAGVITDFLLRPPDFGGQVGFGIAHVEDLNPKSPIHNPKSK